MSTRESKKYCGTCQKAGKTEKEYTSHWMRASREVDAVVTCPLILSTVCSYCRQAGHWKKYCSVLADKKVENKIVENKITENKIVENKITENKIVENKIVENKIVENKKKNINSWASIVQYGPVAQPVLPVVIKKQEVIEILPMLETPLGKTENPLGKTENPLGKKIEWATLMKMAPPIIVSAPIQKQEVIEILPITESKNKTENPLGKTEKPLGKTENPLGKKIEWATIMQMAPVVVVSAPIQKPMPFPSFLSKKFGYPKGLCWADDEESDQEEYDEGYEEGYDEEYLLE